MISARCMLCYVLGPAAADGLLDAIEREPGRPMGGWDGSEAPRKWMNRVFPSWW
ncbi:hypothetical protein [Streptomyces sp. C]|uniref:hypothetical protein n=1 Tax=Streptomyces sp. C TaxID=253839 RepID=UPI0002FB9CEA|nr:hypothetical protein [Streptomyces sp. C]